VLEHGANRMAFVASGSPERQYVVGKERPGRPTQLGPGAPLIYTPKKLEQYRTPLPALHTQGKEKGAYLVVRQNAKTFRRGLGRLLIFSAN
jgi:hypothetical protein